MRLFLGFFCDKKEKECFCAALYTCYSHISPDVALELGWLNGYHNFVMPFLIQNLRHTNYRLTTLETRTAPPKEDDNNQDNIAQTYSNLGGFSNGGVLMLENGGPMMGAPMQPSPTNAGIDMSGFAGVQQQQQPQPGAMPPNMGMMNGGGGMPQVPNPAMMGTMPSM